MINTPYRLMSSLLGLSLAVLATAAGAEDIPGGFGLGPGMLMIENVRPGTKSGITEGTQPFLTVFNGTSAEQIFSVEVIKPSQAIAQWEMGYTDIPDASWLSVDKTEVKLGPKSQERINLTIKVPDKKEYYNRKWMAGVACSPGKREPGKVGMQVLSRVQIETLADSGSDGADAGPLALSPSICEMFDSQPGGYWMAIVKLRNNTPAEQVLTISNLTDTEKDPKKHERFFGLGFERVTASWVIEGEKEVRLKPNEIRQLMFKIAIPANADRGKRYEELICFREAAGCVNFLRVRTDIATKPDANVPLAKP